MARIKSKPMKSWTPVAGPKDTNHNISHLPTVLVTEQPIDSSSTPSPNEELLQISLPPSAEIYGSGSPKKATAKKPLVLGQFPYAKFQQHVADDATQEIDQYIKPYLDPATEFEAYNDGVVQDITETSLNLAELATGWYPKLAPFENFENYLPNDLPYGELYRRSAALSTVLQALQAESDAIDKELLSHDLAIKASERQAEDDARALRHLTDANFRAAELSRERKRDLGELSLLREEPKLSKEEMEAEKRKRGRLIDAVKFDDQVQADAYGFEYSSHPAHIGQQPLRAIEREANGDQILDNSRTRTKRRATQKIQDAESSSTPETESEDPPAKRIRKNRVVDDNFGVSFDSQSGIRSHNSRTGTPAITLSASGKRIGRPPKNSKLQNGQPQGSINSAILVTSTAPQINNSITQEQSKQKGHRLAKLEPENRVLLPLEEAELHSAAEALGISTSDALNSRAALPDIVVEKMTVGKAIQPQPKKRGRPRKVQPQAINDASKGYGVFHSTEQVSISRASSASESRPTTSSSTASNITIGGHHNPRNGQGDHTLAVKDELDEEFVSDSSSWASSPRPIGKKRGFEGDVTAPDTTVSQARGRVTLSSTSSFPKSKRIVLSVSRSWTPDVDAADAFTPTASRSQTPLPGKGKRKRALNVDELALGDHTSAEPASKKYRIVGAAGDSDSIEVLPTQASDNIDELDPEIQEMIRKQRAKEEKSRKLSENMKKRWHNGGMAKAQETRRANNAAKKAAAGVLSTSHIPLSPAPILPTPYEHSAMEPLTPGRTKRSKHSPVAAPPRAPSSRARKPTGII